MQGECSAILIEATSVLSPNATYLTVPQSAHPPILLGTSSLCSLLFPCPEKHVTALVQNSTYCIPRPIPIARAPSRRGGVGFSKRASFPEGPQSQTSAGSSPTLSVCRLFSGNCPLSTVHRSKTSLNFSFWSFFLFALLLPLPTPFSQYSLYSPLFTQFLL
jgi:hypothetical protein